MEQSFQARKAPFDIDALLHPSRAFRHPLDVVRDTEMTLAEKRSVLASWASDACAIESNPALRATRLAAAKFRVAADGGLSVRGPLGLDPAAERSVFHPSGRRRHKSFWFKSRALAQGCRGVRTTDRIEVLKPLLPADIGAVLDETKPGNAG
jgi:hypothetical protein